MANKALVAVVGPSGSGKSTSLRNLDATTTRIIDIERKGMPFRNPKLLEVCHSAASPAEVDKLLDIFLADKSVKMIVIESFTKYAELALKLCQTAYKGYDIYAQYNKMIGNLLEKCKNDHAVVVFTAIDEIVKIPNVDGSESSQRRIKVGGKQWEGMIEKEMLMVLFTEMKRDKTTGKITYNFQTNSDGTTSAKTPMGMFTEPLVENDMAKIIKQAEEYYSVPPTTTT